MAYKDQRSNEIRRKLHEIGRYLTTEDLKQLTFLARDQFDSGQLEKIDSILGFFELVIDSSKSNDQTVRYIVKLLNTIQKPRLAVMLKKCSISLATVLEKPVPHYVKRDVLWSKVVEIAHSDQKNTAVTLVGGVGIGKTELMKDICFGLQEKYVVMQVLEASKCSDILQCICQILKQISFDVQPNQDSIISCLKRLETPFVFSLDISRLPHTDDNCNSMRRLTSQIQSLPYCQLLLRSTRFTSCVICKQSRENTVTIIVDPLDHHESITALKNLNVTIDHKCMKDVVDHCQGFPIHFNEVEVHNLPGFLDKPIYHANTQHIYADEAFRLHVERCGREVKKALACFCLIKDEFPPEFAVQMLEVERETVSEICNHLIEEQLLLERSGSYQMPWIVQHYMTHMINADGTLRALVRRAKKSLIQLLLKFLYKTNELFMHYPSTPKCRLYDELLHRAVLYPAKSRPAVKALQFYKKYKRSFEWSLKEGINDESLELTEQVTDCVNECVSFLAKAMEKSTAINIYQRVRSCRVGSEAKLRNACTDISIGFLKIYYNGCQCESKIVSQMLKAALKRLRNSRPCRKTLRQLSEHLHLKEVEAHCLAKLGHSMVADNLDSFDEGLQMVFESVNVRQQACNSGSGSKLLIAAAYCDIAKIHVHMKRYAAAEKYFTDARRILQEEDKEHPFLATTLNSLAKNYKRRGDMWQASKYSLIARCLGEGILGDHLDTARFIRQHADAVIKTDVNRAKALYDYAKKVGKDRMDKAEYIKLLCRSADLCDEEEAARLREEVAIVKQRVPTDWNTVVDGDSICHSSEDESPPNTKIYQPSHMQMMFIFLCFIIVFTLCMFFYKHDVRTFLCFKGE